MYQYSDSDSKDSDEGVRFKTESVRNRNKNIERTRSRSSSNERYKDRQYKNRKYKSSSSSSEEECYRKRHKRDKPIEKQYNYRSKDKKYNKKGKDGSKFKDCAEKKNHANVDKSTISHISKHEKTHILFTEVEQINDTDKEETQTKNNETNTCFGPALPPHLINKRTTPAITSALVSEPVSASFKKDIDLGIGPDLPPHLVFRNGAKPDEKDLFLSNDDCVVGPSLPPHMIKPTSSRSDVGPEITTNKILENTDNELGICGPTPEKQVLEEDIELHSKTIGPVLPPHLRQVLEENASVMQHYDEEEAEEEAYGPMPVGNVKLSNAHLALEERALQMRLDQLDPKDDEPTREKWMLELPENNKNFGLGPRQFRSKAGPDLSDRSGWTDTPMDKAKKRQEKGKTEIDLKKEAELKEMRKRDKEQEQISKKHKKHKESLVESHQKKLKKEKSETVTERKPFNRETDLQVNKFDEAQKKAVLKKAQLLDNRFSSGQSKFL